MPNGELCLRSRRQRHAHRVALRTGRCGPGRAAIAAHEHPPVMTEADRARIVRRDLQRVLICRAIGGERRAGTGSDCGVGLTQEGPPDQHESKGAVSVIDLATNTITARWTVGGSPDVLQVSTDGRQLWTGDRHGDVALGSALDLAAGGGDRRGQVVLAHPRGGRTRRWPATRDRGADLMNAGILPTAVSIAIASSSQAMPATGRSMVDHRSSRPTVSAIFIGAARPQGAGDRRSRAGRSSARCRNGPKGSASATRARARRARRSRGRRAPRAPASRW